MYVLLKTIYNNKIPSIQVLATSEKRDSLYCELLTESECYYEAYNVVDSNDNKIIFSFEDENPIVVIEIQKCILINW